MNEEKDEQISNMSHQLKARGRALHSAQKDIHVLEAKAETLQALAQDTKNEESHAWATMKEYQAALEKTLEREDQLKTIMKEMEKAHHQALAEANNDKVYLSEQLSLLEATHDELVTRQQEWVHNWDHMLQECKWDKDRWPCGARSQVTRHRAGISKLKTHKWKNKFRCDQGLVIIAKRHHYNTRSQSRTMAGQETPTNMEGKSEMTELKEQMAEMMKMMMKMQQENTTGNFSKTSPGAKTTPPPRQGSSSKQTTKEGKGKGSETKEQQHDGQNDNMSQTEETDDENTEQPTDETNPNDDMNYRPPKDDKQPTGPQTGKETHKYAQRWRGIASQVLPRLEEDEQITIFINTLPNPFFEKMIGNNTSDFNSLIKVGDRIEQSIKAGKIAAEQTVESKKPNYAKKKKRKPITCLENLTNPPTKTTITRDHTHLVLTTTKHNTNLTNKPHTNP
ncbi:hypothetical protein Lal_00000866 [Lupinus albus]|nr:hypothetical protein Lal_00000866 [Lupinus albus]